MITSNFFANNTCNDKIKIKDFNFISEVDFNGQIDSFFDENLEVTIYLFPMKGSNDKLLAYQTQEDDLIPVIFLEEKDSEIISKDINNRLEVLNIKFDKQDVVEKVTYFEANDSKLGFAKSCLGQSSTAACIGYALSACDADPECRGLCFWARFQCLSSIAIACAVSCNKAPSVSLN